MITRADRIAGRAARQASQWFTATAAAALLAACAPGDDVTTASAVPDAAVTDAAEETGAMPEPTCPVIESRDWIARVSAGTADSGARLLVTGELDLPTPGYTVTLKEGPADRRMPPAQHLLLELTPPDGMVSQVSPRSRYATKASPPMPNTARSSCSATTGSSRPSPRSSTPTERGSRESAAYRNPGRDRVALNRKPLERSDSMRAGRTLAAAAALAAAIVTGGLPAANADDDAGERRSISVSGTGEAMGTPDLATINLGVQTVAPTASEAAAKERSSGRETHAVARG